MKNKHYFIVVCLSLFAFIQQSKAQCAASFTSVVSGGTVTFTNTSSASVISNSTWDFGDSSPLNYTSSPTHSYNAAGTYNVCLAIWDSTAFCADTFCASVTVGVGCNNLMVTVTSTDETVASACDGTATASVSGGTAPYAYTWSNATTTASLVNLCPGVYTVTVTDANGCTASAQTHVNSPFVCTAGFGTWVSGNTVSFYNTSNDTTNSLFQWNFGDASGGTGANATHTYAASGTYTVTLIMVSNMYSCTDTFVGTATAGGPLSCSANFGMVQDSFNLLQWYIYPSVAGQAPLTYLWDFGDATTSSVPYPNHTYAAPGQYTICLTITDALGCSSYFCDSSSVQRSASSLQMQYATAIDPNSVAEHDAFEGNIFPNPAGENLDVVFNRITEGKIQLTDLTGKIVYEQSFSGKSVAIDVSALPQGIYNCAVTGEAAGWNRKVVVIH